MTVGSEVAAPGAACDTDAEADAARGAEASRSMDRLAGVGVAWKLVGQIGIQGIRLMTVAILARLLDPSDYGAAAIAIALASFAPTVADMGMGSALVQTDTASRRVRSTAFWGSLGFGIGLSLLLAASAVPVGQFLGDGRVGVMVAAGGLTFAIFSVGSTSQAMFVRAMRFRSIELRFWFALVVGSVLAVAAAVLGAGPWALVLQQIVLLATFVAALWWRAGWRPTREFSTAAFRQLASFAIRIAGGRWARLLEILVLSLLVGRLVGVPALGAWTFAWSMVILPLTVIAIPIAEVLFSAFSRLRGERERIADLWLRSLRILAAVVLPLLVGLVVVAPDLIPVVFGAQWHVSVGIIQVLSIYVIIRCLQSWNSVVLDAAGKPQITLWTQVAALCLTPVAVLIGAQWSVEAVAVCFVVAQLIAVEIPSLIFVLAELRLSARPVAARLLGIAGATSVMAIACLLERWGLAALGVDAAERAALTISFGAVVYAGALRLFAPDICQRAAALGRRIFEKAMLARRRRIVAA